MLIATGVYKARDLTIDGAERDGVIPALDFLTASNRLGMGDDLSSDETDRYFAKEVGLWRGVSGRVGEMAGR